MESNPHRPRKTLLIFLLGVVVALFFLAWSQASLNLSFIRPQSAAETIALLAVSALIFLAFVIFALILLRILLKLYVERRQAQLGSRFKTKMVAAFLGLSLVPVCFLFAFAYGLLNRSIDKWFGIPFDVVRKDATAIAQQLESDARESAVRGASQLSEDKGLARDMARRDIPSIESRLARQVSDLDLASAACFDAHGRLLARAGVPFPGVDVIARALPDLASGQEILARGPLVLHAADSTFILAARPLAGPRARNAGSVVSITSLPPGIEQMAAEIQRESEKYDHLSRERRAVKRTYFSVLALLTLLILFVATWLSLFLSKRVTVPIQALIEATHEVSKGNLEFRVSARADVELGSLIHSFNEMTRQLLENRRAIEQAAQALQGANRELEKRGNTMEAILQNIPTGVIFFDAKKQITQINATVERIFGRKDVQSARSLTDLFSADDAREIARLFRRAERQGVVTRQMDLDLGTRRAAVAVTLSSIRSNHLMVGSVMVLEDLSELLRAQKAAAWQEVAQRICHEIKNPLTPIQLSSERILRLAEREATRSHSLEWLGTVAQSASLIAREVATLKTLVDEFSDFARFPSSRPVLSNLNFIVEKALIVFDGRLEGIEVHRDLAFDLPPVLADPDQMKRAVVNLIDNAAEALEQSVPKEIWVSTQFDPEREVIEVVVADSGPGILEEAKEKLFLPYFSTKARGTGLGLAIVSRIVTEHHGGIRVEENRPTGTKFIIELPVERPVAASVET